jgi:hypothetical protein
MVKTRKTRKQELYKKTGARGENTGRLDGQNKQATDKQRTPI